MPSCVSSTVSAFAGRMPIQCFSGAAVPLHRACSTSGGKAKSQTQSIRCAISIWRWQWISTSTSLPHARQHIEDALQIGLALRVAHVDVGPLRGEGGPQQAVAAVAQRHRGEGHARARTADLEQLLLGGAVGEHALHREEEPVVARLRAVRRPVQDLRRSRRHVVDDDVGPHLQLARQRGHVVPVAQARIDLRVVDGVEAGVAAVDGGGRRGAGARHRRGPAGRRPRPAARRPGG
ncbi:MAG: hypothetical protein RL227_1421 [Pseudomonadota bacterium]